MPSAPGHGRAADRVASASPFTEGDTVHRWRRTWQRTAAALGASLLGVLVIAGGPSAVAAPTTPGSPPGVRYDDLPDGPSFVAKPGWPTRHLTYFFENDTADVTTEQRAVLDAMGIWSRGTALTFTPAASADDADLRISWATGDHSDGFPFDGLNGTLAHAYFPPPTHSEPIAGDVHFDDAETWTTDIQSSSAQPIDLVTVAAHELGHALGLDHSAVTTALMDPFYRGSHRFLDPDDMAGIRSLYGGSPGAVAWVWSGQETPPNGCFTPAPPHQFNTSNASATICRTSLGRYEWQLPRVIPGNGNVQVSAYGPTPRRCKVVSWGATTPAGAMIVNVACFALNGTPADSMFVARFQHLGPNQPAEGGYLWSSNPTGSGAVPTQWSWNSFGGANSVSRNSVGVYTANLPGLSAIGGTVHVTAYGGDNVHCKVNSWFPPSVIVNCFTPAGAPADSRFTLFYGREFVPNLGGDGGYGWTQDTDGTISTTYSWHSKGAAVSKFVDGPPVPGMTAVQFPRIRPVNSTTAMVTAYGGNANSCQVGSFVSDEAGGVLVVARCFRPDGTPENSLLTASYMASFQ